MPPDTKFSKSDNKFARGVKLVTSFVRFLAKKSNSNGRCYFATKSIFSFRNTGMTFAEINKSLTWFKQCSYNV